MARHAIPCVVTALSLAAAGCGGGGTTPQLGATKPAGDVWASTFSAAGIWGSPVRIGSALGPGNVSAPQVVMDANGDAAVVWIDECVG